MTLKLGSITTIVISSPDLVKEAFHTNDQALSTRTAFEHSTTTKFQWCGFLSRLLGGSLGESVPLNCSPNNGLMLAKSYGKTRSKNYFTMCKKVAVVVMLLILAEPSSLLLLIYYQIVFFSIDLAQYHYEFSQSFYELVRWGMEEVGKPNVVDYFPVLRLFDPQRSRKRMTVYLEKVLTSFNGIINERLQVRASSMNSDEKSNDLLDSLLNLAEENNSELSLNDIKHLFLDLFYAGTDTTSITVDWAMAELLHNPKVLIKAQNELRGLLGKDGKVEEIEIDRFPYLKAVVKETFRLHLPGPFLVPHKAETEVDICGFIVPKNAQVFVNAWGMGRDSKIWPNPNSFMPERFLDGDQVDFKGLDFELIPFGTGRRICPGMPLAYRVVHLMLASFVYAFDWKLADGLKPEDLNMSEKFGFALHKAEPLLAIPVKL